MTTASGTSLTEGTFRMKVMRVARVAILCNKSATVEEKRRILNLVCSNWRLVGKKLEYQMRTPFAELAEGRSSGDWLRD